MSGFLTRTRPAPPVRMVHLGVGNFFRAHQAWYTQHASDAADWGYAAFDGRSCRTAKALQTQDNVYTLAFSAAAGDRFERIESIVRTHCADDTAAWIAYCTSPEVAIISTTVTEAGYLSDHHGGVLVDDAGLVADLVKLRAGQDDVVTMPARLVAGLRARRAAGIGPIAVMSCDNLQENGTILRQVTTATAALVDAELATWIDGNVSFVTTMVDRITPRPTAEDLLRVEAGIGMPDASPVITEPFSEWVISGEFPAGRPDWESAGVTFTDDIDANERRKLWLLNGSHSLLAYVGMLRGRETVADAMLDPYCRETALSWWESALSVLEGDRTRLGNYVMALAERFDNPRMRHLLSQIGTDGSLKIPVRWIPACTLLRARGELPEAVLRGLAAFTLYVQRGEVRDVARDRLLACVRANPQETMRALLDIIAPALLQDAQLLAAVDNLLDEYSTLHADANVHH